MIGFSLLTIGGERMDTDSAKIVAFENQYFEENS